MGTLLLRAVGDNLLHRQIYESARIPDGYDFSSLYEHVRPLIREADIAVLNQETILVLDERRVSSFPVFGTPASIAEAIADAGFHVITHASNHALDKGYSAIQETAAVWKRHADRIVCTGIHTAREDSDRIRVVERNGIRVAFLNYTALLNFHPIPPTHPRCVDVMKPYTRGRIRRQIRQARSQADIVAVFPHWGCEYLYEPVPAQKAWAAFLAESGADIIIGTHPHVLQYTEVLRTRDGRRVPCFYSLGNFVSCQINQGTMLGGMADVVIEKGPRGTGISRAGLIPLVTHAEKDFRRFSVYPLSEYTDELSGQNQIFTEMAGYTGTRLDTFSLHQLYHDILNRQAMRDSWYKTPGDVRKQNLIGVWHALTRGLKKVGK